MSGTAERALVILPRKYQGRLHHGVYRPEGTLLIGGDANDQNLPQSGRLLYCVITEASAPSQAQCLRTSPLKKSFFTWDFRESRSVYESCEQTPRVVFPGCAALLKP